MRKLTNFCLISSVLFGLSSCDTNSEKTTSIANKGEKVEEIEDRNLKVSAFLIYDDGTVSETDILNNENAVLLDVNKGRNAAKKPSHKTKLVFSGNLAGLTLHLEAYRDKKVSEKLSSVNGSHEVILNNTGCDNTYFAVFEGKNRIYENALPFGCS